MMKKILKQIKNNKTIILIALSIIIVGIVILLLFKSALFRKIDTEKYANNYFSLEYDSGWSIKNSSDNNIELVNTGNSTFNINIVMLEGEYKYASIDDLIDEILYNIDTQNTSYKLLYKNSMLYSVNEYKSYKLLYENNDSQIMFVTYKKSDKLIIMYYEAKNDFFDILLDSVENMAYTFNIIEKKYDVNTKLSLKFDNPTYTINEEADKEITDNNTYEIAYNNYYVKYSIPKVFELFKLESTRSSFYSRYNNTDLPSTSISVNIGGNVFEYIERSIKSSYEYIKKDEEYKDYSETLTKMNEETYLFKNKYTYINGSCYDKDFNRSKCDVKKENAILIKILDKNHIITFDIRSSGETITKKLIDSIKVIEDRNYPKYITSTKSDGYLISDLQMYSDYNKNKIQKINIKLPDKYDETNDYNNDIFTNRTFGLNYNEDNNTYDYEIEYDFGEYSEYTTNYVEKYIESENNLLETTYGKYEYFKKSKNISVNNNKFLVYDGGTTKLGGIMFTIDDRYYYYKNIKILICELLNYKYLAIVICGNDKEITDDIIKDVTNFQVIEMDS